MKVVMSYIHLVHCPNEPATEIDNDPRNTRKITKCIRVRSCGSWIGCFTELTLN
jgi:hypothetical protein